MASLSAASGIAASDEAQEVPAARQSLLSSTRNADYNVPLSFDPDEAGLLLPPPEIEYDLTKGKELRIGDTVFGEQTFVVTLRTIAALNPALGRQLGSEANESMLFLRWPAALLAAGDLEVISRTGAVLWKHSLSESDLNAWKKKIDGWRALLKQQGVPDKSLRSGLFATQIGLSGLRAKGAPFWNEVETFRVCLTRIGESGESRLCSRRMGARLRKDSPALVPVPISNTPRILVMDKTGEMKGSVPVKAGTMAQFYADLSGGESYEFRTLAPKLDLVDISDTSKKGLLRVSGFGIRPLNPHVILNPDKYNRLTLLLGFEPTIGDTRKFWAAGLREEKPQMSFPGESGGIFRQRFQLSEVPRAASRIHLHRQSMTGTYADGVWLYGRKQPKSKVESTEYRVDVDEKNPTLLGWKFRALKKGEINRSYLTTTEDGKSYASYFELYRAYANELSARMSAIATAGQALLMGEIAFNHWFENILWWDHYWLTKQRWGLSAKAFKSLNQLPTGVATKANLHVMTVDLKYRLTPGLWTRDESVGAIFSYQQVTFGEIKAPMTGVGAFWARSMPRSLNDFLNYFPLMDYPKWVDMEFIYYVNSMNADVVLSSTMALNFHGQVLWRDNFFGEAGFGFKRYGMTDVMQSKEAKLNTVYGTVGMGFKF
ncbi:MAG: hypothetical protein KF789_05425 [Bdellovibrionaceae bacterium]|nr:hypothetical protein [Pseudobdellovibrionaceae bacterium]